MNPETLEHITGSLSDLQDIITPASAGFLPPAPAWIAMAVILVFFLVRKGLRYYRVYKENQYRREAEKELDHLEKIILTASDPTQRIQAAMALPGLLKQTAVSAYKRETVAHLSQDQWVAFLDKRAAMNAFSGETGQILSWCAYGSPDRVSSVSKPSFVSLTALIRKWIRTHAREQE